MKNCAVLDHRILKLLQTAKAKESTRYALNFIGVLNGDLATTDGRRLVVIHPNNSLDLQDGVYIADEWVSMIALGESEQKFPVWKDIIPTENENKGTASDGERLFNHCTKAGLYINYAKFSDSFEALFDLGLTYNVYIGKPNEPLMLKGNCHSFNITFLLMPVNVE